MEKVYAQEVEKIIELTRTSEKGLSYPEAKKRLEENGKNAFVEKKKPGLLAKFFAQFKDILIAILLVSALISLVVCIVTNDPSELFDVFFILFAVVLNAVIGLIQENKSDKALEELKNMTKPFSTVIRNGKVTKIKSEDVVIGDIVVLEAGDIVCADLRLIEAASLQIEESALTGESVPVEKHTDTISADGIALGDCANMAFMGTVVAYGRGKGVVVATGMQTEMGKIATALEEHKPEPTPLTKRMKKTNIVITIAILCFAVLVFILDMTRGESFLSSFMLAVIVAVSAIPEGLPACLTVTMANGVKKMSGKNAIVKKLPAVETLGSTEVICSDKTGTLTLNRMTIKKIYTMDSGCEKANEYDLTKQSVLDIKNNLVLNDKNEENLPEHYKLIKNNRNLYELMRCMLLCNDVQSKFEEDNILSIGDPTEVALVRYGYTYGFSKENIEGQFPRVNEIPFESERKLMTTINKIDDELYSFTKGAIDNLLARCSRILDNGSIRKITKKDKEQIMEQNLAFADNALRVLGFAFKKANTNIRKYTSDNTENDLIFIGLVGMIDPPREEVRDAIKTCRGAGITTIMITGDHKDTAFAIAKELEIATSKDQVITGQELDILNDQEFATVVENYRVYARVNPEHKVKIVKALQAKNKIVAMTGDGVNDAPSIKSADIGIGMGITGTDVTKNAADLILTDDNFATIVGAVKEGRRIYSNILKIFQFFVGTNIAEAILVLVFRCILGWHFFSPALILWINLVADSFVGIALGFEEAEKNIMSQKPKRTSGSFFAGESGKMLFYTSFVVMMLVTATMFIGKYLLLDDVSVTTMAFLTLCIGELFHSFDLKSDTETVFTKKLFKNKAHNWAFLGSLFLTVIIVLLPWPFLQDAFGVCSLNWYSWLICFGLAFLIVPFTELYKLGLRKGKHKFTKKTKLKVSKQKA